MKEYKLKSFDDTNINVKEYANISNPKGVIQLIHGMNESSDSYDNTVEFFNKKGFIVFIQDLRGHGKNIKVGATKGFYDGDIFYDSLRDIIYFS